MTNIKCIFVCVLKINTHSFTDLSICQEQKEANTRLSQRKILASSMNSVTFHICFAPEKKIHKNIQSENNRFRMQNRHNKQLFTGEKN